jgi:hypothetical protein
MSSIACEDQVSYLNPQTTRKPDLRTTTHGRVSINPLPRKRVGSEWQVCQSQNVSTEGFTPSRRIKTVSKPYLLQRLGMLIERRADSPNC